MHICEDAVYQLKMVWDEVCCARDFINQYKNRGNSYRFDYYDGKPIAFYLDRPQYTIWRLFAE